MTKTFPLLPDCTCPELAGYKLPPVEDKAREKFEFSESDLRKAISWATNKARRGDISAKDIDDFIISLRTPRKPIAIEVEMVEATDWIETHGNMIMTPIVCIKPATNPDGTVKVVRWVYE